MALPFPDEPWELPSWRELVLPSDDGELHHGSEGCKPADGILIEVASMPVAIADCRHIGLDNLTAWDREYYQYLRLREITNAELWAQTLWRDLVPGQLLAAWDKFHGITYLRGVDDGTMSFGGDWSTIEAELSDGETASAPTLADLIVAIRADRLERVREVLAAGVDPNGELGTPAGSGLALGVSVARSTQPLWEAVHKASPHVTEALLAAGARVDACPAGGMTALMGAVINGRDAHVPILLRYGASPTAAFQGKTVLEIARARGLSALFGAE